MPVQVMNLLLMEVEIPANKLIIKLSSVTDTTAPIPVSDAEDQNTKITGKIDEAVKKTKLGEIYKAKLREFLIKCKWVFCEP